MFYGNSLPSFIILLEKRFFPHNHVLRKPYQQYNNVNCPIDDFPHNHVLRKHETLIDVLESVDYFPHNHVLRKPPYIFFVSFFVHFFPHNHVLRKQGSTDYVHIVPKCLSTQPCSTETCQTSSLCSTLLNCFPHNHVLRKHNKLLRVICVEHLLFPHNHVLRKRSGNSPNWTINTLPKLLFKTYSRNP